MLISYTKYIHIMYIHTTILPYSMHPWTTLSPVDSKITESDIFASIERYVLYGGD